MILELDRRDVHHSNMCICCCSGPLGALIFLKTWKVGDHKKGITSRPKARDGHWYPCPAQVLHDGSCYVSRAAAPEGIG